MKTRFLSGLLLAFMAFMPMQNTNAQTPSPAKPMTRKEKNEVIDQLLIKMNGIYIFPEVAKKAEAKIRQYQKEGAYAKITEPKALAETLSGQLREIVKDKHLSVWYRPEEIAAARDTATDKNRERNWRRFITRMNMGFPKLDILEGNVGYLKIDGFGPVDPVGPTCSAAMAFLANTDALIIDLRENGGGEPEMVQYLASYFFDGAPVHINDLYYRAGNQTTEYWTIAVPGPRYVSKPVYVLTSSKTFSGGEELAYDLQTQKRATLIGETTGGGANPGEQVEIVPGFYAFIPNGRAINPITKTNWEGTGVMPDIATSAEASLKEAHILALQLLRDTTPDTEGKKYYSDNLDAVQKK